MLRKNLTLNAYRKFIHFLVKSRAGKNILDYQVRVDSRMKIVYAILYGIGFAFLGLCTGSTFYYHLINILLAIFYYFCMKSNIRGADNYHIYFDLFSWVHVFTVTIVWATFTPVVSTMPLWTTLYPLAIMFVLMFGIK